MAGNFWNNSWTLNPRLGSCPDLLFRSTFALTNVSEVGALVFNSYYFGPASTGSISGSAVIGFSQSASLGSTGAPNSANHFWNNSWLLNPRLGSCPDLLLRQVYAQSNINEAGVTAFPEYYFGVGAGILAGSATFALTQAGALSGVGALAGAVSTAFTESGGLTGIGALAAACAILFTESGAVSGAGPLTASGTVTFTESGALLGAGFLAGAITFDFTASATLTRPGLIGDVTIAFSESGSLSGAGVLAGGSAIDLSAIGDLIALVAISGAGSFGFTAFGTAESFDAVIVTVSMPILTSVSVSYLPIASASIAHQIVDAASATQSILTEEQVALPVLESTRVTVGV